MHALRLAWDHFEEGVIVFLLTAMTLVTFVYVIINNLYNPFFLLGDFFEIRGAAGISAFFFAIGDFIIYLAQEMTWGNALSKALFAWLIFFGLAYGVRRSEEHTSELQSRENLVCRLLLEKKKKSTT